MRTYEITDADLENSRSNIIPDFVLNPDEANRKLADKIAEAVMDTIERERGIIKSQIAQAVWVALMIDEMR